MGLRGFEGSRVSRASGRGVEEEEVVWAARQAQVSAGGRGCLAERPSFQAPLRTRDSDRSPLLSQIWESSTQPLPRIPESEHITTVSPGPGCLDAQPLLSERRVHTPAPTPFKTPELRTPAPPPQERRPPPIPPTRTHESRPPASFYLTAWSGEGAGPSFREPRGPHLLLSPSWSPALRGLRGRGQMVAMVPDCLGLLSDPWGLPRVCKEGEGDPSLGEVQHLPLP
jgi:hypothetical protein